MNGRLSLCGVLVSTLLLSWACSAARNSVNLYGEKVDMELLEGEWSGDYFSKDTGRSGTIAFTLTAGRNEASGEVLMIPVGSREPYHPVGFKDKAEVDPQFPELLAIKFVEIMGGKIRGELTPYWDPEFQRRLKTTFEGVLMGDAIEGTFESRMEQSPIYFYGQWKVSRKKK